MLEIVGVGKRYPGGAWGVRDVDLSVGRGVTLLGPNGAGKSTLMRILATLLEPTVGTVRWQGEDVGRRPNAYRRVLGYLPQDFGVYPHLTAREFLHYIAAAKGMRRGPAADRIDQMLHLVSLTSQRDKPLAAFSGGMRQRLGVAQALLDDPKILIVDEPTAGLDPEERVRLRSFLSDLSADRVVLLSTHIVSDVESTASRLCLLRDGRVAWQGTPTEIVDSMRERVWQLETTPDRYPDLCDRVVVVSAVRRPDRISMRVVSDQAPSPSAVSVAPVLEDAYLRHVGAGRHAS